MAKKVIKVKEPIKLRFKELRNGNVSIYLDIFFEGTRRYEFLKLYLIPGGTKDVKAINEATLMKANTIKAKRIEEMHNNRFGFSNSKIASKADIIRYMKSRALKVRKHGESTIRLASCTARMLQKYSKSDIVPFCNIDKKFIIGFVRFLYTVKSQYGKALSKTTVKVYYKILVATLNSAVQDDIISVNPTTKLKKDDKPVNSYNTRCYLTIEEIKALYKTDCKRPYVKQIFLFCCMCGLRLSDVTKLTWDNITQNKDNEITLDFIQTKTDKQLIIPLSKEAIALLPKDRDQVEIFGKQLCTNSIEQWLKVWAKDAGITKKVTFHVSRHTYATMLLTLGADLYTVSKLLGHSDIRITQLYAEVINEKKQKAVDLIPNFE